MRKLCEHGTRKDRCKFCDGSGVCKHKRRKDYCKTCGGSTYCEHGKQKRRCPLCCPVGAYKEYQNSARKREYEFVLTLDEFKEIVKQPCFYCNDGKSPRGVDRWNNSLGYTRENSRPCCGPCNKFKGVLDCQIFINRCQRIAAHHMEIFSERD